MSDQRYSQKILDVVLQDLAEVWLRGPNITPRSLLSLKERHYRQVADGITNRTGERIVSKTIRNHIRQAKPFGSRSCDNVAAAWLIEMGIVDEKEIKGVENGVSLRFEQCAKCFETRRDTIFARLHETEGISLEYKEDGVSKTDFLAKLISSLANMGGGLAILGAKEPGQVDRMVGLNGNEPVLHKTRRALGRLSPRPSVEHGWSIVFEDEKLLYVILVGARPTDMPVNASGEAWIRHSDGEINPWKPRLRSMCTVTLARYKLIGSFERILSITTAQQISHLSRRDSETLAIVCLSFIAETFATFLADLISDIRSKQTTDMRSKPAISDGSMEQALEILRSGNVEKFLEEIRGVPIVFENLTRSQDLITRVFQLSRLWQRNAGFMDEEFINSVGGDLAGETSVTVPEVRDFARNLDAIAQGVDHAANEAYKLDQLSVAELLW